MPPPKLGCTEPEQPPVSDAGMVVRRALKPSLRNTKKSTLEKNPGTLVFVISSPLARMQIGDRPWGGGLLNFPALFVLTSIDLFIGLGCAHLRPEVSFAVHRASRQRL